MEKENTLSTGKLPLGGLHRNSVVRITDRPDMTSAVYGGRKALNQTNKCLSNPQLVVMKSAVKVLQLGAPPVSQISYLLLFF